MPFSLGLGLPLERNSALVAGPWNPGELASLVLWLDSTDVAPNGGPRKYTTVAQNSTSANHGTLTNFVPIKWVTTRPPVLEDIVDGSLTFSGDTDVVTLGALITQSLDTLSVSWRCKRNVGGVGKVIGWNAESNRADINYVTATTLSVRVWDGSGSATFTVSNDGEWHHYVLTCNAGTAILYEDGAPAPVVDDTLPVGKDMFTDGLGNRPGGTISLQGILCNIRLFNTVLSQADVTNLFNGIDVSGEIHYWKLDGQPQSTAADTELVSDWRTSDILRNQFLQATETNRPSFDSDGINLLGAIQFNGTDNWLSCAGTISTNTHGGIVCIGKTGSTPFSADQVLVATADIAVANKFWNVGIDAQGKAWIETNVAGTITRATGHTVLLNSEEFRIQWTSNGTTWIGKVNGVVQTLTIIGSNSGNWFGDISARDNVTIGALITSGGASRFFEGWLGEIVLVNEESDLD